MSVIIGALSITCSALHNELLVEVVVLYPLGNNSHGPFRWAKVLHKLTSESNVAHFCRNDKALVDRLGRSTFQHIPNCGYPRVCTLMWFREGCCSCISRYHVLQKGCCVRNSIGKLFLFSDKVEYHTVTMSTTDSANERLESLVQILPVATQLAQQHIKCVQTINSIQPFRDKSMEGESRLQPAIGIFRSIVYNLLFQLFDKFVQNDIDTLFVKRIRHIEHNFIYQLEVVRKMCLNRLATQKDLSEEVTAVKHSEWIDGAIHLGNDIFVKDIKVHTTRYTTHLQIQLAL
mmetsp:Transcript_25054/g.36701  ORF Transcript_25054/g.36701 Transcript_25054/m.36701 type:complete len:289 (-) Transcript_25054:2749-3615(-)